MSPLLAPDEKQTLKMLKVGQYLVLTNGKHTVKLILRLKSLRKASSNSIYAPKCRLKALLGASWEFGLKIGLSG